MTAIEKDLAEPLQECRKKFEEWFAAPRPLERNGESYMLMSAHSAWNAWEAAWLNAAAALDAQGKAGARRYNETGNAPDDEYLDPHGECAAEIQSLRQQVATARAKLRAAAGQFRAYERLHLGKQTDDGAIKATTNRQFAEMCEGPLAPSEGAGNEQASKKIQRGLKDAIQSVQCEHEFSPTVTPNSSKKCLRCGTVFHFGSNNPRLP